MLRKMKTIFGEGTTNSGAVRSIAWNYAGYIYQIGINIGVTSYIARRLAVPEYGLLLFVMSLSSTLYLLDMGISSVLVQAYVAALLHTEKTRLNDLLCTAFVTLTVLGAVGALILAGVSAILPGPFNIPLQYLHEASIVVIIAAFIILCGLPTVALDLIYQASQRFDRLNQIQFLTSTLQFIFTVGALAFGLRIVALALVQLIVTALRMLLLAVALPSTVPNAGLKLNRFHWSLLRPLVHLGKWALLNNVSIYALDLMVWIILGTLGSMREAAMFGLASKLPTQLWNLVDRGADVFLPTLSRSSAESDTLHLRRTYLKIQTLVFGAVLPFVVLGCVFARPLIQIWAGNQYAGAAAVMQWLLLAALAHAIGYPSHQLLYACVRLRREAAITFSTVVMSSACCLLVSRHGAVGLAAAIALPPLLINCAWTTPVACRLADVSLRVLVRVTLRGLAWPAVALVAEVALILILWPLLSPFWLVFAAVVSGCVYLGFWNARTALPLFRNQTELVG